LVSSNNSPQSAPILSFYSPISNNCLPHKVYRVKVHSMYPILNPFFGIQIVAKWSV
jgi:hypothetical protein